jgi:hypothetical protein
MNAEQAAAAVAAAVARGVREFPDMMHELDREPSQKLSDEVAVNLRSLFA